MKYIVILIYYGERGPIIFQGMDLAMPQDERPPEPIKHEKTMVNLIKNEPIIVGGHYGSRVRHGANTHGVFPYV